METLSLFEMSFCAFVLTAAFAVRGGTGFGASTVAIPLLVFAVPLQLAVSVTSALIIANSIGVVTRDWKSVAWHAVLPTVPFSLAGVVLGLYCLASVDEALLLRALGAVVVIFAIHGFFDGGHAPAVSGRRRHVLVAATGVAGGSLGTLFGAGVGPVYAMYMKSLRLDARAFRVSVTSVILFQLLARVAGYAGIGYYGDAVLMTLAAAAPFMLLGTWLGDALVSRVDQRHFGHLVSAVLLVSGLGLLLK